MGGSTLRCAFIRPAAAVLAGVALLLGTAACGTPAPRAAAESAAEFAAAPAQAPVARAAFASAVPAGAPGAASLAATAPAAAELGLKFGKIPDPLVKVGGTGTVRPATVTVDAAAGELVSRRVTVKGLPGAADRASVAVRAGTYSVTTTAKVRSRLDGKAYSYASTQKLTVRPALRVAAPRVSGNTVRPAVTAAPGAKVTSRRITVTRNGKTIKRSVASATLPKGTYRVKTTAKYRFTATSTAPAASAGTGIGATCRVAGLGTLRYGSVENYVEGNHREIAWTCTGGFDGTLAGNGYYFPDTSGASEAHADRDFVFHLEDGPASFSLYNAKVGTTFRHTLKAPRDLYRTTARKVSGTTSTTHTVRVP
ncbi:hypothetical protein NCCP1664_13040 [Zafaria cholistanensis]|uniref:Uncharacterized protein n=1 Tax=Zafaria cholistanensis TaxID=1682741 RepID=A0A5A7NS71_9MICC|nr:hypothetical protein [Zafaria cholistanensis]GER22807.1 hypothetical protein NCCP1664_13040 [Zafaria cholistanensis]